MSDGIVWEDPGHVDGHKHDAFAEGLRENPGKWALLGEYASRAVQQHIRRGIGASWQPAGSFEAAGRKRGDKIAIFVRYVGTDDGGDQ